MAIQSDSRDHERLAFRREMIFGCVLTALFTGGIILIAVLNGTGHCS